MNEILRPDDTRDALRKIGGLLVGLAAAMIFIRKGGIFPSANRDRWAAFPLFLVVAAPAVNFYSGLLAGPERGELRVWQSVHSVFALLLVPIALREFVVVLGGSPGASLNTFWIFAFTAGLAFYTATRFAVRVQLLLGSIAVIVSWTALWDKILSGGVTAHWGIYRGLLGIVAIGLLAGALYVWRTNPGGAKVAASATRPDGDLGLWKASELLTGAGIAAVIATGLGIASYTKLFAPLGATNVAPIQTSNLWDTLLLLVSLGLVAIGSQIGTRGPVYVGAIGLLLFLVIAGFDLNSTPPHPFRFGIWPWVLLVLGLIGIALSFRREASLGDQPRRFIENLRGR
ncbi:MAG: hypothetical protein WB866_07220 [Solirubrobacterales bacterium]